MQTREQPAIATSRGSKTVGRILPGMIRSTQHSDFDGPLIGGRYQLGPLLGKGGQGRTLLALDVTDERLVAVKEFDLKKVDEWKALELFERECRVLSELDHPGVPDFIAQLESEEEGVRYLVMEFIDGQTLRDHLRKHGVLNEDELREVLVQVLEILSDLHARVPPLIHRDIKPANLVRRENDDIALVDFGGVRDALREGGGSTVVGTFGYMAPEQLHGEATPATDLFSLGATLVTLGTGIEPEKLPRKGLRMDFSKSLEVSRHFAKVLRWMTEPDPEERPSSAVELRDELENRLGKFKQQPKVPRAPEPPVPAVPPAPPVPEPPPLPPELIDPAPPLPPDLPWRIGYPVGVSLALVGLMVSFALRAVGWLFVPLVFLLLSLVSSPNSAERLKEKQRKIRREITKASRRLSRQSRNGLAALRHARRRRRHQIESDQPTEHAPSRHSLEAQGQKTKQGNDQNAHHHRSRRRR